MLVSGACWDGECLFAPSISTIDLGNAVRAVGCIAIAIANIAKDIDDISEGLKRIAKCLESIAEGHG